MIRTLFHLSCIALFGLVAAPVHAAALELHKVTDTVYAIVGPLTNRSPENLANNATFGFVISSKGVVLVDPGGTYKGAAEIAALIKTVTEHPVTVVINTGGQDHRWLGNGYFKERGAKIIAAAKAVEDQKARETDQFFMLGNLVKDEGLAGTEAVYADETFDTTHTVTVGDTRIELHHTGQAHTPGDSFVWLPDAKVVFSGDIVYTERMLTISSVSHSGSWIKAFEAMAAKQPQHVIPGHGKPTTLAVATKDSLDYLKFLRDAVKQFRAEGKEVQNIGSIDQSRFGYLQNYELLKGRNAQQVYDELEWE